MRWRTGELQAMTDHDVITNALSFDIEDWFHLVEIKAVEDPSQWGDLPSLVVDYTAWILDKVGQSQVKATFFIVGWVAQRYPKIVRRIAEAGHEVAIHSFWHRRADELTPEQLHEDLARNIDVVQQQSGKKVLGFRAPSFSVTLGAEWIFDVLHDLGLKYDASLFPAPRGQGGYPCRQAPHEFTDVPSGRPMLELPMSVMRLGPMRLPFSGGGYLRVLPKPVIRLGFRSFNKQGLPVVVYLHPRDFASDCPRVPMPMVRRFKCYVGLKSTEAKFDMLLKRYRFNTCAAVLGLEG